jgi:glycosyltransferase involved in cell wall biosynthesis
MKILFLTKYEYLGASSRYRTLQYLPYLKKYGIDCDVSPLFSDDYLIHKYSTGKASVYEVVKAFIRRVFSLLKSSKCDLIVIEKEIMPYFPSFFEKFLNITKIPYIVDYDDAIFHNYDKNNNPIVRSLLSKKIARVMKNASLVIAGSPYLASYARMAGAKVIEIPTVIDLKKYPSKKYDEPELFTIGWIGSPSTQNYLIDIAPALRQFCNEYKCKLTLIGANDEVKDKLKYIPVEIVEWKEEIEIKEISRFSVGIMPLPDAPWTRGKCGFKLIQYMGCFLPVIASPVGVNIKIVEHGANGYLAKSQDDWYKYLKKLYKSRELGNEFGLQGRKKVEEWYNLDVQAKRYADILERAVRKI